MSFNIVYSKTGASLPLKPCLWRWCTPSSHLRAGGGGCRAELGAVRGTDVLWECGVSGQETKKQMCEMKHSVRGSGEQGIRRSGREVWSLVSLFPETCLTGKALLPSLCTVCSKGFPNTVLLGEQWQSVHFLLLKRVCYVCNVWIQPSVLWDHLETEKPCQSFAICPVATAKGRREVMVRRLYGGSTGAPKVAQQSVCQPPSDMQGWFLPPAPSGGSQAAGLSTPLL